MLPAELYYIVYLIVLAVFTIIVCLFGEYLHKNHVVAAILCVAIILFIGLRPISGVFVDMWNYHTYFIFCKEHMLQPVPTITTRNPIFAAIYSLFVITDWPEEYFYLIIACIYFGCMFWACYKLFPENTLIAFLVVLCAFSTFSYGTNGIKAGAAASIFLLAIAYYDKLWLSIIFAILSYGFHHAMSLVIIAFIIVRFIKNPNYYFAFWLICIVISALHITWFQYLFAQFSDEGGAGYLMPDENGDHIYITGFRLDFILYSSIPIVVYQLLNMQYKIKSERYIFIMNLYMLINSVWMLCMYANFTNRIAYLSWFILPIALVYPLLRLETINNKTFYLNTIVIGHLAFTLFMNFVYNG